jgi:hypothetical protein
MTKLAFDRNLDKYPYVRARGESVTYRFTQSEGGRWLLSRNGMALTRCSTIKQMQALGDWFVLNDRRVREALWTNPDSVLDLVAEARRVAGLPT